MVQLQRIADGVVFDVLGTKTEPSFVDAVFMTYAEGSLRGRVFGFGRAVLESQFTAYPPQEKKPVGGQLIRSDRLGDGTPFDVVAVGPNFVRIKAVGTWSEGISLTRKYVQTFFTAYPPQEQPDRVDQLMQETDGWEPLTAYRVTYCPVDNVALEPGKRVVEAYAGALVDASRCATCGRFFADDTLTEIKLWKD